MERENQNEQGSRYELWHDAAFTLATLLSLDEPPEDLLELLRRDLTAQPAHLEESAAALQDPAHQILAHQALSHDLPTTELPSSPEEIARARAAQLSEQFGQITGPYGASRYLAWDDKPSRPQPLAASLVASSTASRDISELIGEPPSDGPKIGARFT